MIAPSFLLFRAATAVLGDNPSASPSPSPSVDPNHLSNTPDDSCSCTGVLTTIVGYAAWVITALAILTLIGIGIRWTIATHSGNATQENLDSLGKWGLGALIVGAAGGIGNMIFGINLFTPHPQAIPGLTFIQKALNIATEVGIGVAVLGIMITGSTAFWRSRHGEAIGEKITYVLGGCVIIASASSITYAVLPW